MLLQTFEKIFSLGSFILFVSVNVRAIYNISIELKTSKKKGKAGKVKRPWKIISSVQELQNCEPCPNQDVFDVIEELSFINTRSNEVIAPKHNVLFSQRIKAFLQYISDYTARHPKFSLTSYFTLYDGWREHTPPPLELATDTTTTVRSVPIYASLSIDDIKLFYIENGRFVNQGRISSAAYDVYPVLDFPMLAFGRHKRDLSVIMIPDSEFIATSGFADLKKEIGKNDIPWEKKENVLFWRSKNHGVGYASYNDFASTRGLTEGDKRLLNQRELFMKVSANSSRARSINAQFMKGREKVSKKSLLKYKYQIDIDGEVTAWSGLWWKLYSNSVVLKVESHYEQWYYNLLIPWEHYIPIRPNFSDFEEQLNWAFEHDAECKQIAQNGKALANKLSYYFSTRHFTIQNNYSDFVARRVLKMFNISEFLSSGSSSRDNFLEAFNATTNTTSTEVSSNSTVQQL
jgi:Glycosyl transferase family 90